jgi:hypothetical protein
MKIKMINVLTTPPKMQDDSTGSNGNARCQEGHIECKEGVFVVNERRMAPVQLVEVALGSAICEVAWVGLLERMISSIESKASRPELPSIPLLRFWSA